MRAAAPASSTHLDSLRLLGLVLSCRGKFAQARVHLDDASAMARAHHGADSVEVGLSRLALTRSIGSSQTAPAEVIEQAVAVGEIFAKRLGPDHYRVAGEMEMRRSFSWVAVARRCLSPSDWWRDDGGPMARSAFRAPMP